MRRLWIMVLLIGACSLNQHGPWLDESGQPLEGSQVVEYDGLQDCDHGDVVFIRFFGAMYAKDTKGVLGSLVTDEGEPVSFEYLSEVPEGVETTHIRHRDREIYFDPETRHNYIYQVYDDGIVERWPRAEIDCDRIGGPPPDTTISN